MTENQILYLSRNHVEQVDVTMDEIIGALERTFREKGEGKSVEENKPGIRKMVPRGSEGYILPPSP